MNIMLYMIYKKFVIAIRFIITILYLKTVKKEIACIRFGHALLQEYSA